MSVELLINKLSKEAAPKPMKKPLVMLVQWLGLSVIWLTFVLMFFHLRTDLWLMIGATYYTYELVSLFVVVVTVGISAIILSYPDMYQKKWLAYLPIIPIIIFMVIMYTADMADKTQSPDPGTDFKCTICICLFSLGPAFVLLRQLRKQATTHPRLSAGLAVLASVSFGALVFRLTEDTNSIQHVIIYHYLPLVGLALIGVLLGKKLLRW